MKFFLLILSVFFGGCCIPLSVTYNDIPKWIYTLPATPDYAYAIGSAPIIQGVPLYQTLKVAEDRAMNNLSKMKSFHIISRTQDVDTKAKSLSIELRRVMSKSTLNAQQVDKWVDTEGLSGERQVFILMKISY